MAEQPARGRVLIIDDDQDMREILGEVLKEEGYAVSTSAHGLEALQRLQAGERPDLLLLDLMMPVMSGWELLRGMRTDPRLASLHVVVITASAGPRSTCSEPVDGWLRKPFDLGALFAAIASVLTLPQKAEDRHP